jgi:hypothetical protein
MRNGFCRDCGLLTKIPRRAIALRSGATVPEKGNAKSSFATANILFCTLLSMSSRVTIQDPPRRTFEAQKYKTLRAR